MAEPVSPGAGEERVEEARSQEPVAEGNERVSTEEVVVPAPPVDLSQLPQWRELEAKLQSERDREKERARKLEEELRQARAQAQDESTRKAEENLKLKRQSLLNRGLNQREVEDILEADRELLRRMQYERDALYAQVSIRAISDKLRQEYRQQGVDLSDEEVSNTPLDGGPRVFEQALRLQLERKALDKRMKEMEERVKRQREEDDNKELNARRESGADRVTGDHQSDRNLAPKGEEAAFLEALRAAPSGASRRRVIAQYRQVLGADKVDQLMFNR